jgi:hypothetical protein
MRLFKSENAQHCYERFGFIERSATSPRHMAATPREGDAERPIPRLRDDRCRSEVAFRGQEKSHRCRIGELAPDWEEPHDGTNL